MNAPRSRRSLVDWITTSSKRMRGRVDPAVAAFRDPARLALGSWRVALRSDRRAQAGTALIVVLTAMAIYAGIAAPVVGDPTARLLPPSSGHPFGTDAVGRDLLVALVHGSFPTLAPAVTAAIGSAAVGFALGALAGFLRGFTDVLVQRLAEALTAVPLLLVVLVAQALIPAPSAASLLIVVVLTRWAEVAQVVRADVLRVMQLDYVLAARALGAGPGRLLARHVLPSVLASAVVLGSFGVGAVVVVETAIAVVGVGFVHPLAWGALLGQARAHPGAWWLVIFPAAFVALALGATVLLGEAMRDTFDPRLRWTRR
ncbi:MAG: ABC transporter permease [Deltaproteobacteria bacterium]|nr:ABC transporter permease [Deltaproteobacteria bacterium]